MAGDDEILTSMAQRPCCPVHAGTLSAARVEMDRLLEEESGFLAALVAADAE